jgi:hypothetical protein
MLTATADATITTNHATTANASASFPSDGMT